MCEFVNFAHGISKKITNYVKKLRKNLEKVKCSSYLCSGFRKRHGFGSHYRLVSLSYPSRVFAWEKSMTKPEKG